MTDTARIDRELAEIAYCRGWGAAFDQTRQNPYIVREYSDAWQRGFQDGIEARRKAEASSVSISIERDADGWPKAMWFKAWRDPSPRAALPHPLSPLRDLVHPPGSVRALRAARRHTR